MQLFINTYGAYVHVKDQMFEIKIPQRQEPGNFVKHHFAAQKVTHILMNKGAALSTDAIILALTYNVDIVFFDGYGKPMGRVWHSKLGSTTRIRKAQLEASLNKTGVDTIKEWVSEKIENQLHFVKDLKRHRSGMSDFLDNKAERLEELLLSLHNLKADRVAEIADTIRGIEGTAGRMYIETLSRVLPQEYKFSGRSSRPAKDAFNAFLNYAYGILYAKIEKALIVAGIDPYLGFLHRDDYNQLSMVYDFIEPFRIYADTVVFRLFSAKKVNKSHTDELANGKTLNKDGKELLVHAFNSFMDNDSIKYAGRNQTRNNVIQLRAHNFANKLIKLIYGDEAENILTQIKTKEL